ncbi:hypothetical protein PISMIDRAFT_103897 [Pisolithus microcarpus 441]|uniref:Uncharacterized protein n=1 Tax=Pisolithus microcarpus 441 TaxID=765257 RepID=A0A0C9YA46_9AGAM|nr:hypothetical protein PISMIDRAFT_121814 [Pisolithus microcarpus 441]KIK21555.1 hypothetical protein PISMIDRAFT_103897 [Pisolithus microcarpus 441]
MGSLFTPQANSALVFIFPSLLESIGPFNACVLAKYQDCWITSPNSLYVPEPFVFEARVMEPLHDGRFGHINCFQWPQLYLE